MSKFTIVATTLLAAFGSGQPAFAEDAITEPMCVCGLSTDADLLSAGLPTLSDPAKTPVNERDSGIDGHPQRPKLYPGPRAAPPLWTRDRPLMWVSRTRAHHGANQPTP